MNIQVPRELLEKYNKAGPRYTSYPTVPAWSNTFTEADYRQALSRLSDRPEEALSLYLHLPFCVKKCHYCGCNSLVTRRGKDIDDYLDRVERELKIVTGLLGTRRRVVQMHWGGGTPNFLNEGQLRRAGKLLWDAFDIDARGEISLEVDPRVGHAGQTALLRELGFNRISLGVQDFASGVQKAIGRIQPVKRTLDLFAACRASGFSSVNIDLVYGLPGQTLDSFDDTLKAVIDLGPDRVACFSYAHVPWVRANQKNVDTAGMPEADEKFELFRLGVERFTEAGYDWIGIDHFARRGDELSAAYRERKLHRNFMGYTTHPDLRMLAFGMSGIGDLGDSFVQNSADLEAYQAALDDRRLPVVRGHRLNLDDRIRRKAILNLMCNLELPFDLTLGEFGLTLEEALAPELERLRAFEEEGFLVLRKDRLEVTGLGRFFIRILCMELDAYLEGVGNKPLFSKTI